MFYSKEEEIFKDYMKRAADLHCGILTRDMSLAYQCAVDSLQIGISPEVVSS
jgi:hypothetical protein